MKQITKLVLISVFLLLLSGCGCEHQWIEANCTAPRTCSLCAETDGDPLGHSWQDASCTAPKTCSLCTETEGNCLPHTPGDIVINTDYVQALIIETQSCSICNETLSTQETVISLVDGDYFLLSLEEFILRLNRIYAATGKTDWSAQLETIPTADGNFLRGVVYCGDAVYARLLFGTKENNPDTTQLIMLLKEEEKNQRIISHVQVQINYRELASQVNDSTNSDISEATNQVSALFANKELFIDILLPVFKTFGATLEESDAKSLIDSAYTKSSNYFDYQDIVYTDKCGDFYTEFINVYLANLSYLVNITTSPEYWMENNQLQEKD